MVREFELPDVGEGVAEGELLAWLVDPGDAVSEDQPVAEVETDKAVVEVPSPVNGTVRERHAEAGEVVPVGTVIVTFDVEGESSEDEASETGDSATSDTATSEAGTTGEEAAPAEAESTTATEQAGDATGGVDASEEAGATGATDTEDRSASPEAAASDAPTGSETDVETPDGRVFAAPSVRRLARELGVSIERVADPDGRVSAADVRAAANGDRPTEPDSDGDRPAAESSDGAATDSGRTGASEESTGDKASLAQSARAASAPPAPDAGERERTLAAPATRRIAAEAGIDLDSVPASEQRDGEAFVTPEAVKEYAAAKQRAQEADTATESDAATVASKSSAGGSAREERVPYRGMRRTIGQQMERSAFTAPHVTHHDTIDVTELVTAREKLKDAADERGISLTYMPFVLRACVAALREFPLMNATLDEESEEIVQKQYYNLGVATATDAGLMVPVIEDAGQKGLLQLATEMNELVERARERTITRAEMQGGTFTVTNVGAIGGEYSTPIINHPEVAILALGAIEEKPRVVDGEVQPRHVLSLSLSFDHRVLDGAVAARFTNAVGRYLEAPTRLLLDG